MYLVVIAIDVGERSLDGRKLFSASLDYTVMPTRTFVLGM